MIQVSCEGGVTGDVLSLDMPVVPDFIIFDIVSHLHAFKRILRWRISWNFRKLLFRIWI